MGDCWSFGSNCHPCGQSRKISIGVMVDSSANTRPKTRKEDEAPVPNVEKEPGKVNSMGDGNNGVEAMDAIKRKQTEALERESSPWVSTRSLHETKSSSEAIQYAETATKLPAGGGMSNILSGVKAAPRTYSSQLFANQMSVSQSGDGKQQSVDRVSYSREGSKNGTKERLEEFSIATEQQRFEPGKEVAEDEINRTEDRREALRMKLWDILETVSSPNKQVSQALEADVNTLNLEQDIDKKSEPVVKPRQNSDTIETDSESPDHTSRRPVTRSLTRKRAPSKIKTNKIKNVPLSSYTRKHPEQNIFSFEEGFSGRLSASVTGGSPKSYRKKRERNAFKTGADRTFIPAKDSADNRQATDMSKTTQCAEKTSSHGYTMGSFHSYPTEKNSEFVELVNGSRKKDSLQLSAMKMMDGNINNLTFPQANLSLKNIVDQHVDLQSPTFEFRAPTKSFSPSSPPETNHGELDDHSPSHCSFNSLLASEPDYFKADGGTESSDGAEELDRSLFMKSMPDREGKDAEYGLSESSSEERDSKNSVEGSPINKGRGTESPSPKVGTATARKPKFMLYPSKRLCSQEDITFSGCSPISASPKGTEESNELQGPSGQNQEDGLANAVTLIALALERVQNKIKSFTTKKSAEVLISVAEGIHLQCQNAESQIQKDVEKLTSLSKLKRKRLETEFEEQKEQLKVMYQKFEEQVNRHIQECKSTVEGLEAQEIEFRGFMEKRKSLQRKLLKQVEEAIETQLNDARSRITAVHKLGREKVLQLRYVVAECLKEGILS